jgi:hypothetical protein
VRLQLWERPGRELLGPIAYLDVDGTIAPACGEHKAGMDMSCQGIWGYAPLIVSLANTKEVLYLVNRPGNVPSHSGAAQWIDKAIDLAGPHAGRVCLRGDADFSLTEHCDRWYELVDFVFGMDCSTALRSRAEALAETDWAPPAHPNNPRRSNDPVNLLSLTHLTTAIAPPGNRATAKLNRTSMP